MAGCWPPCETNPLVGKVNWIHGQILNNTSEISLVPCLQWLSRSVMILAWLINEFFVKRK